MKIKDYERLRASLDTIDNFGEATGEKLVLSVRYIWSKIALIFLVVFSGIMVLIFSLANGLSKKHK